MAKKRVGILHMLLTADTRKFSRGMRGAIKQIKALGAAVGKATIRFAKYGAVLAGAAVAGLAFLVKQQFSALDVIAKTSDRLGIQTEALIALQHAASEAGIESAVMTKGLERMNVAIGEIVTGTALEAKAAFDFIGLSAKALDKMPGDEAFALIIERILQLESATQRAAIANDILGRAGKKVLSFGKDFTKVLKEARAEIKGIGGLFSRKELAQVEAANDAFALLVKSISAIASRITAQLAPVVTALSDGLRDMIGAAAEAGGKVEGVFNTVSFSIARTIDVVTELFDEFVRLKTVLPAAVVGGKGGLLGGFLQSIKFTGTVLKKLLGFDASFGVGGAALENEVLNDAADKATPRGLNAVDRLTKAIEDSAKAAEKAGEDVGGDRGSGPVSTFKAIAKVAKDIFGGGLASASELGVVGGQARFGGGGMHTPTTRGITKIANNSDKQVKLLEKIVNNGLGAGLAVV